MKIFCLFDSISHLYCYYMITFQCTKMSTSLPRLLNVRNAKFPLFQICALSLQHHLFLATKATKFVRRSTYIRNAILAQPSGSKISLFITKAGRPYNSIQNLNSFVRILQMGTLYVKVHNGAYTVSVKLNGCQMISNV